MMSPKQLEAMKRLITDKQIRGGMEARLALALKDAVHEIEELQHRLEAALAVAEQKNEASVYKDTRPPNCCCGFDPNRGRLEDLRCSVHGFLL